MLSFAELVSRLQDAHTNEVQAVQSKLNEERQAAKKNNAQVARMTAEIQELRACLGCSAANNGIELRMMNSETLGPKTAVAGDMSSSPMANSTSLLGSPSLRQSPKSGMSSEMTNADPLSVRPSSSMVLHRSPSNQMMFSLKPSWSRDCIWGTDVALPNKHPNPAERFAMMDSEPSVYRGGQWFGFDGYVMFPHSTFRTSWNISCLFLITYDMVTLPFLFAYQPEPSPTLHFFEWLSLCFWTSDMLQGPFVGYFEHGTYVKDFKRVFKKYITTWFAVDVLIVCPEWLLMMTKDSPVNEAMSGFGKVFKSVRILRVLRLLRLAKIKDILDHLYDMSANEITFILLRTGQHLIFVLVLNHWVACCWYAIGKYDLRHSDNSWLDGSITFKDRSLYYMYLTSLHWSLTQFTPASLDVHARGPNERLFSIIVLFFAMIIFASIVGSITTSITKLRSMKSDCTRELWILRHFLREQHVSENLSHRIHKYVEHHLKAETGKFTVGEVQVLKRLTAALQNELKFDLHSHHVLVHPFFERLSNVMEVVMHRMCVAMQNLHCSKGQLIFHAGDEAKCMYFLKKGRLEYMCLRCGNSTMDPQHPISWIAEAALWVAWRYQGELTNADKFVSELLFLDHKLFFEVMSKHPQTWMYAAVYGESFVQYLNTQLLLSDIINEELHYKVAVEAASEEALHFWNVDDTKANQSNLQAGTEVAEVATDDDKAREYDAMLAELPSQTVIL